MKESKYQQLLAPLLSQPFFRAADARARGIPSRVLAHFCSIGLIEKVSWGLYRWAGGATEIPPDYEELVAVVLSIPQGVICLVSALCYYGLTDQIMREYWIAVPNTQRSPRRLHTRIVRMRNMSLGLTAINFGKSKVKIFDRERTVIDSFRYLSDEIAIKALQAYLKSSSEYKPDLPKLSRYAKTLRININKYILALTT